MHHQLHRVFLPTDQNSRHDPSRFHLPSKLGQLYSKPNDRISIFLPDDDEVIVFSFPSLSFQFKIAAGAFVAFFLHVPKHTAIEFLYPAVGPLLAAGVSGILDSAAINGRLKSDTYKRLCLFLAYYSFLGLASIGAFVPNPSIDDFVVVGIVYTLGLFPALRGLRKGVQEGGGTGRIGNLVGELKDGGIDLVKNILPCSNLNAFGYLGATGVVTLVKFRKLMELKNIVLGSVGGSYSYLMASRLLDYSKFVLLFGVVFTLKDAANRNRLDGSTFIKLNFLSSFALLSIGVVAGIPTLSSPPLDLAAVFFSFFCAGNGFLSQFKKSLSKA